jgi:uncharacterized lipoprotein YmbA
MQDKLKVLRGACAGAVSVADYLATVTIVQRRGRHR